MAATAEIVAAETAYISAGNGASLHLSLSTDSVAEVEGSEMVWLYDNPFSRRGSPVRPSFYDKLRTSAPHGRCPYCAWRAVATLDHYLAKSKHPAVAITPANLVPSCSDCNKLKLDSHAADPGQQLLHPYFDDFDGDVWLFAEVCEENPPALIFSAEPPTGWPDIKKQRIVFHLETFGLAELYASHGARLIAEISARLNKLFDEGGAGLVSEHLAEEAETRRALARNCWQVAAYDAMSKLV